MTADSDALIQTLIALTRAIDDLHLLNVFGGEDKTQPLEMTILERIGNDLDFVKVMVAQMAGQTSWDGASTAQLRRQRRALDEIEPA